MKTADKNQKLILRFLQDFSYLSLDLRIVDITELAALVSLDMHAVSGESKAAAASQKLKMLEFTATLGFFRQLPFAIRASTLQAFSWYLIVIETGYCTAQSRHHANAWMWFVRQEADGRRQAAGAGAQNTRFANSGAPIRVCRATFLCCRKKRG